MSDFTFHYSQPDAYHFCQDSVLAPRLIASDLVRARTEKQIRALDVCAGCGVMGFELLLALGDLAASVTEFDFLELNREFASHFRANLELTGNTGARKTTWIEKNYACLLEPEFYQRYDLIVANPPYFEKEEGTLSANEMNNRARFFLDGSLKGLLKGFANSLAPGGRAYFLMKSGKRHGA